MYADAQERELLTKLESPDTDARTKERLKKLLSLSVQSLRLLRTLAAVETRQQLDLTLYTKSRQKWAPAFQEAIEELLQEDLIIRRGQYYRPTSEGIAVLRLHLDTVKNELDERK